MRYMKNNDGYALLLVLLLIILFISVSAVMASATLSHSNQEKTIDVSNQSIVAAEMGSKLYMQILLEDVKNLNDQYRVNIKSDLDLLYGKASDAVRAKDLNQALPEDYPTLSCESLYKPTSINEWISCETDLIENKYTMDYVDKTKQIFSSFFVGSKSPTIIYEGTSYELKYEEKDTPQETIDEFIGDIIVDLQSRVIELPIIIIGKHDLKTSELNGTLIIHIPNHLKEDSLQTIKTILPENDAINKVFLPPNQVFEKECPSDPKDMIEGVCNYTGSALETYLQGLPDPTNVSIKISNLCTAVQDKNNCNLNNFDGSGGTMYISPSEASLNLDNLNKLQDIAMYVDGNLTLRNVNSAKNNTIVARSFSLAVAMNFENSNLIVLGNSSFGGNITWTNQTLEVSTGSKLCINLNGVDLSESSSLDTINFTNGGQLMLYPTKEMLIAKGSPNISYLPVTNASHTTYFEGLEDFLNSCKVDTSNLPEGHSMKKFVESQTKIEDIIQYTN